MALRNVYTDGDPLLRKKSRVITKFDDKLEELIYDMKETMASQEGVGLAAVQVGILKRLIIVDPFADEENLPILPFDYNGPMALINPEIIEKDGKDVILKEGCLSVPNAEGYVKRASHIRIKALNEKYEEVEFDAYDYFARIIQHEMDHLEGILFTDKTIDEKNLRKVRR